MRLKKLELFGFKSFAKRTEIVFGEGITGIVGPNGSGKSNIGDAVRWVLGEQSAKTLRGGSMSDVIFGGTQLRKPMSYCEVSLTFENEDHFLPVDFTEVVVTRRVYRSGESEYYLNRASCRLKDIIDLFRDTGIGKEGYSIIGQGRIDDILSRKSEDRRQVFEEAAGIVKFRARKEEADKKLQRTRENADRIDDILEELTRQLKPLERQAKDAREYLELSGQLKTLDLNLFLAKSDKLQEKIGGFAADISNLTIVTADTEQLINEKIASRDMLQENISGLDEKLTGVRQSLETVLDNITSARTELSAAGARADERRESRVRCMEDLQRNQEMLDNSSSARCDSDEIRQETARELDSAKAEEAEAIIKCDKASAQVEEMEAQLEKVKQQLIDSMNSASSRESSITRLTTMSGQMKSRLEEVESEGSQLQSGLESISAMVAEEEAHLQKENEQQKLLDDEKAALESKLDVTDASLNRCRADFDERSGELRGLTSRHDTLRDVVRDMEGYSQSVRCAINYSREHNMQGVKGVLSQIISVPKELETAIDMALGAAQQNIVTDNEGTAKELIEYLKRNRLGRATFLPVTTVTSKLLNDRERRCMGMAGCLGVASDLISFPGNYRGIVENLLGRTVISDNLDHGIEIMRQCGHTFRLVTLTGDVMHSGGSMTGGSVTSRGVNFLSRERELKEMQEKIGIMKKDCEQLKSHITSLSEEKQSLKKDIALASSRCHEQEINVATQSERLSSIYADKTRQEGLIAANSQSAMQLMDSMDEVASQLRELEQDTQNVKTDELKRKSDEAAAELAEKRKELAGLQQARMEMTLKVNSLSQSLEVLQRDMKRIAADTARLENEQESLKQLLSKMDADDQRDNAESEKAAAALHEAEESRDRTQEIVNSLEKRRSEIQGKLKELLNQLESLHQNQTRDSDKLHRLEIARQKIENELKQLQNRIWDSYEMTYAQALEFRDDKMDLRKAETQAAELTVRIRGLGNVNVNAVQEYADTKARHDELSRQQEDLRKAESDLQQLIASLLKQMEKTFVQSFTLLQGYFSETFVRLFGGGHAELKLTDVDDPLNCGIEVNAQPPGKKLQLLSLLSGGERALTAIAILFAMLKLKPTPFCILDEIEAALDDANIGYYADYLKEYSRTTQFIVITHRKGTMERCNSLYGVAMEEQGVSKMVSVSLKDYDE